MADDIFAVSPSVSWQVDGGEEIVFPAESTRESYRNRIIRHKRYKRDGARLEDTYSEAIVWTITVAAYNSPDHEVLVDGLDFYPTKLNELLDSFLVHKTGTLNTLTRGPRRCRAESYEREETNENRDSASVVLVFVEDNEDDSETSNWTAPTAASVAVKTAEEATRECEDHGVGEDVAASLNENASAIESYSSAPSEFAGDIDAKASLVVRTVDRIEKAHANLVDGSGDEVRTLLTDPSSSRAGKLLRKLSDTASRAVYERLQEPAPTPITRPRDISLFDLAPVQNVSVDDLINLNPGLDPFFVPAGTTILVPTS